MKTKHCPICRTKIVAGKCDCKQRSLVYNPDQDEIRAECRRIQATWSEDEELKRRCVRNGAADYGRVIRESSEGLRPS